MTIKSLLIGSAAAVVAVSGAQAADAIVAADPEPVEYVQVCQDFGTGYFYIPGTETCLKIGGLVRGEWDYKNTASHNNGANASTDDSQIRSFFELSATASSNTELGTLTSFLLLEGDTKTNDAPLGDGTANSVRIAKAHISIGDGNVLNVGYKESLWDTSIGGEQVFDAEGNTANQISYSVALDSATFHVQAAATQDGTSVAGDVAGRVDFTAGDLAAKLLVGYDGDNTASNARVGAAVQLSYMGFGAYYQWSEKANSGSFGTGYRNVFGGSYSFAASDKLAIAAGLEYADGRGNVSNQDAWGASLQADYTIVTGLVAQALVTYKDFNTNINNAAATPLGDETRVRLRLTRSF